MRQLRRAEFNELVQQALQKVPSQVRGAMKNMAIVVEDWPSRADLDEAGMNDRHGLLGLYHGVPLPDREGGAPLLPDKITLFQRPIEEVCETKDEIVEQVRVTVLHEIGHYLGLSEEALDRLGYG